MEPYENMLPGMFFHPSAICNHICSTLLENFWYNTITVTLKMSIVNYLGKKHLHSVSFFKLYVVRKLESVLKHIKFWDWGLGHWIHYLNILKLIFHHGWCQHGQQRLQWLKCGYIAGKCSKYYTDVWIKSKVYLTSKVCYELQIPHLY